MNWLDLLLHTAIAVVAVIAGWLLNNYFPSYISKKGENLATKEDVQEITALTEEVQKEFKESFELFTADLKFKNDFVYKQYSGLYCKLYAIVVQSEYVRKYVEVTTGNVNTFDDEPFIEISSTERKNMTVNVSKDKPTTVTRQVTYIDTPISEFNKATLCDCIIDNGDLASQKLLKLAVSCRFALEHTNSTLECDDKKHDREEAENEEARLIRELVICIVTEYNEMRKYLKLEYEDAELKSGQVRM